jgi:outer membrane biosynthesis protein TonB
MKKGKAVGIGIAVIVVAIVFGIASLPDEVLLETPMDASKKIPEETLLTEVQPEKISSKEQTVEPEPEVEPETTEESEPETTEESEPETTEESEPETTEESEGNVIEIKISDGVGGGDK